MCSYNCSIEANLLPYIRLCYNLHGSNSRLTSLSIRIPMLFPVLMAGGRLTEGNLVCAQTRVAGQRRAYAHLRNNNGIRSRRVHPISAAAVAAAAAEDIVAPTIGLGVRSMV